MKYAIDNPELSKIERYQSQLRNLDNMSPEQLKRQLSKDKTKVVKERVKAHKSAKSEMKRA